MADTGEECSFFDLPWEDVVFVHILPHLSLRQLFQCRRVCKVLKEITDTYFKICRKLDCSEVSCRLTGPAFDLMTKASTHLQCLRLAYCKNWLDQDALRNILKQNPRLQELDLTGCSSLTNLTLFTLTESCRSLKELRLRECRWVSSDAVTQLSLCCTDLEVVDLGGCWEVVDACVASLVSCCTKLKFLSVNDCYSVSDQSISLIAKCCSGLQHLGVKSCWRVTNSSIVLVGEYCKQLKSLEVKDCRDINEISLARLRPKGIQIDVKQMKPMFLRWEGDGWPRPSFNLNIQI